jgi:adenylate cyclase
MVEIDKKKFIPRRMDLITTPISITEDEECIDVKFEMKPDPKRYEEIEFEGKPAFLDKFTHTVIPWDVFAQGWENAGEIPIIRNDPKQQDFCTYLKERKSELLKNWDNKYLLESDRKPVERLLEELSGKETYVVILYIDMEGSTRLSSKIDPETYAKIIKIFLMQMSKVVDNFTGYVLKFVGDCVIGIFPAEGKFTATCDNAIQAAMIMCSVVEDVINPVFAEKDLPEIGFHIGLDIGVVTADRFGALDVASFDDLIGYSMNLTAKIQSKAGHNEILIGKNLFDLIHNNWQKYCEKVDLGEEWKMKDPRQEAIYEVYRCRVKWICKCGDE